MYLFIYRPMVQQSEAVGGAKRVHMTLLLGLGDIIVM